MAEKALVELIRQYEADIQVAKRMGRGSSLGMIYTQLNQMKVRLQQQQEK